MQIIFQDPYASLNPRQTIEQTLIEPLLVHKIGSNREDRRDRVVSLLEEVGLGSEFLGATHTSSREGKGSDKRSPRAGS